MSKRFIVAAASVIVAAVGFVAYVAWDQHPVLVAVKPLPQVASSPSDKALPVASGRVLGEQTSEPAAHLVIYGGEDSTRSGDLIELSAYTEPSVELLSYNLSGEATVDVFQVTEDDLLNFYLHDKTGQQLQKKVETKNFRLLASFKKYIASNTSTPPRVILPLGESGVYYLKVSLADGTDSAFVTRSRIGTIVKDAGERYIFWSQSFKTKRSISGGSIKLYKLQDKRQQLAEVPIGKNGIATSPFLAEADLAIAHVGQDFDIVPINLTYFNSGYSWQPFPAKDRSLKYFIFTDRPVYKPGDTVYFKSIVRDDGDGRYSLPNGSVQVKILKDWDENQPLLKKLYSLSGAGTVDSQFTLPKDAATGSYQLKVGLPSPVDTGYGNGAYISFLVDYFRKPEYSLNMAIPNTELVMGDRVPVTISGSYFFGQPLVNQKVSYAIYSSDFYDYEYYADATQALDDSYRYGYWNDKKLSEGEVMLDSKGQAVLDLDTTSLRFGAHTSQVFSIEATTTDSSQNPAFVRKNIVVFPGEFGVYREGGFGYMRAGSQAELSVTLLPHRAGAQVGGVNLTATVHRNNWVYDGAGRFHQEEDDLPALQATTDKAGKATLRFTPAKSGSYKFSFQVTDSRGNVLVKDFYGWASGADAGYYDESQASLTIKADRDRYKPGEVAKLFIASTSGARDVFLTMQRGHVDRVQVVSMTGNTIQVDMPITGTDMPNVVAVAQGFSATGLERNSTNIKVSTESKKLFVTVTPQQVKFGPGETVTLNVETKDSAGNAKPADVAVWAVDKALFELVDQRPADVFSAFWSERYDQTAESNSLAGISTNGGAEMGGCFGAGTRVAMADGTTKPIEDVKVGDTVLSRGERSVTPMPGKVVGTESVDEAGLIIINLSLHVTANHLLNVNGIWKEAGSIQLGDNLVGLDGSTVPVTSLEWQGGKFPVYNLSIERYHTYFADGVWVHNQKGGSGGESRSVFKDTAYWNPSVRTDAAGRAQVHFKLPDNLTTWATFGIGSTSDTTVGQTSGEIVVSKAVVVRPILPNILRVGDSLTVSAIVQNFTDVNDTFSTSLSFDAGEAVALGEPNITLPPGGLRQVSWNIQPRIENDKAKLVFSARSTQDAKLADTVVQEIPVRVFGFWDHHAETANEPTTYSIKLAPDRAVGKASVSLAFAPTLVGTLPDAMKYLVDYPYGCVEQTTSRFVPAVIAKSNPTLFADALQGKDIDAIIKTGIERLRSLQQSQGGWTWWYGNTGDPFITAYVVEYLVQAKALGYDVDADMLARAQAFLEQESSQNQQAPQTIAQVTPDLVAKAYALSFLSSDKGKRRLAELQGLTPDYVALAVMADVRNGYADAAENGLSLLRAAARTQGDGVFWDGGNRMNFGSADASTGLVIRALLMSPQAKDIELAARAVRFLVQNRHSQYWSNTFATAQIIRAVTDLSTKDQELNPSYTYTVTLDGAVVQQGTVDSYKDHVSVTVPESKVKADGSELAIATAGSGSVYSTLMVDQFRTDRDQAFANHGLAITRSYSKADNADAPIAVGDVVDVTVTVNGLQSSNNYGVIDDQLPAGLIPINRAFKNEQGSSGNQNPYGYPYYWDYYGQQVTENGVTIPLYDVQYGSHMYTYQARAVSEGTFSAPPVEASLMYAPDVYGRSQAQTLTITRPILTVAEKDVTPVTVPQPLPPKGATPKDNTMLYLFIALGAAVVLGALYAILSLRRRSTKQTVGTSDSSTKGKGGE